MKTIYLTLDSTSVEQIAANSTRAGRIFNKLGETAIQWSEKQPEEPPYVAVTLDDNFDLKKLGYIKNENDEQNIVAGQFIWKNLDSKLQQVLLQNVKASPVKQNRSALTKELFTEHYSEEKLNSFQELKFLSDNYSLFDALVDDFNQFADSLSSSKEVDFKEILPNFKNRLKALVKSINKNENLSSVQKLQCIADIIRFQHAALGIKYLKTPQQLMAEIPRALTSFITFEVKKKEEKRPMLASVMSAPNEVNSDEELHKNILNYQECFVENFEWGKSGENSNDSLSVKDDLNISEKNVPVLEKDARTSENHCVLLYILLQEKSDVKNINEKFGYLLDGINKEDFANLIEKAQTDKLAILLKEIAEGKESLSKYKPLLLDSLALLINNPKKDESDDLLIKCLKNNTVLCDYIAENILQFTGHQNKNENIQYKTSNVFEGCGDKQKLQLNILFAERRIPESEMLKQKKSKINNIQKDVFIITEEQWSKAVAEQFENVCTKGSVLSDNPLQRIDLSCFVNNFTALKKQCAKTKGNLKTDLYLPEIAFEKVKDILSDERNKNLSVSDLIQKQDLEFLKKLELKESVPLVWHLNVNTLASNLKAIANTDKKTYIFDNYWKEKEKNLGKQNLDIKFIDKSKNYYQEFNEFLQLTKDAWSINVCFKHMQPAEETLTYERILEFCNNDTEIAMQCAFKFITMATVDKKEIDDLFDSLLKSNEHFTPERQKQFLAYCGKNSPNLTTNAKFCIQNLFVHNKALASKSILEPLLVIVTSVENEKKVESETKSNVIEEKGDKKEENQTQQKKPKDIFNSNLYGDLLDYSCDDLYTAYSLADIFDHLLAMNQGQAYSICKNEHLFKLMQQQIEANKLGELGERRQEDNKLNKLFDHLIYNETGMGKFDFKKFIQFVFSQKDLHPYINDKILFQVLQEWSADFAVPVLQVLNNREGGLNVALNAMYEKLQDNETVKKKTLISLFPAHLNLHRHEMNKARTNKDQVKHKSTQEKLTEQKIFYTKQMRDLLTSKSKEDSRAIYIAIGKDEREKTFAVNLLSLADNGNNFFESKKSLLSAFFCENQTIENNNTESENKSFIVKPLSPTMATTLMRLAIRQTDKVHNNITNKDELQRSEMLQQALAKDKSGLLLLALHQASMDLDIPAAERSILKEEFAKGIKLESSAAAIEVLLSMTEFSKTEYTTYYYDKQPLLNFVKDKQVMQCLSKDNIVKAFKANPFMDKKIALLLVEKLDEREVLDILYDCHKTGKFTVKESKLTEFPEPKQPNSKEDDKKYGYFDFEKLDDDKCSDVMKAMMSKVNVDHLPTHFKNQKDMRSKSVILSVMRAKHQIQNSRGFFSRLWHRLFSKEQEIVFEKMTAGDAIGKHVFKKENKNLENEDIENEDIENKKPNNDQKLHKVQTTQGTYKTIGSKLRGQDKTVLTRKMFGVNSLDSGELRLSEGKIEKSQYTVKIVKSLVNIPNEANTIYVLIGRDKKNLYCILNDINGKSSTNYEYSGEQEITANYLLNKGKANLIHTVVESCKQDNKAQQLVLAEEYQSVDTNGQQKETGQAKIAAKRLTEKNRVTPFWEKNKDKAIDTEDNNKEDKVQIFDKN